MVSVKESPSHVLSQDSLIARQFVSQPPSKKDIRLEAGPYIAVRFGDEVMERADRFALSEQARSQVQGMYAGLLSQASDTVVEAQEAELVEAL